MKMLAQLAQPPIATNQILFHSTRMWRGKTNALQPIHSLQLLQQLNKGAFPAHRGNFPPSVHIHDLTQQRDLPNPLFHKAPNLTNDLHNRTGPLLPSRRRDNAEGAVHVAPLHDGNKSGDLLRNQNVVPNRLFRPLLLTHIGKEPGSPPQTCFPCLHHQIRYPVEFLGSDNEIQTFHLLFQGLPFSLSHATKKAQNHARILFPKGLQIAHFPKSFLLRQIANATRVEQNNVRFLLGFCTLIAAIHELACHLLGIPLIHLATVSF